VNDLNIYYLWDERLRIDKNRRGENHWFCYITEMFSRLGVGAEAMLVEEAEVYRFGAGDMLFLGADALPSSVLPNLKKGLNNGMVLVGFGTEDADGLFGIQTVRSQILPEDEYQTNGYFKIFKEMQGEYLPVSEIAPPLPIFSPTNWVINKTADVFGAIYAGGCIRPGFTKNANAYYFAFDLMRTLWLSAQGKPVYKSERGLSYTRISDSRITPLDYDTSVAYGDYYLYIIQSILHSLKTPMLHRLPPDANGGVPDLLLFYAGDEDSTPHISARASEIMHGRGLPYHVNLMPCGENLAFVTTPEEFDAIKSRGHELAMHYDMVSYGFSEENFVKQYRAYLKNYGETTVSTVGHCLAHFGWAERGRYLERLGILGDSCRCAEYAVEINDFNLYGFAFGVSYPMFLYDDAASQNRRLEFVDIPIAYYEPRIGSKYTDGAAKIHKCLDDAAYFGRMINLFTHPHYVADNYSYDNTITLAALDEVVRYIKEKGWNVIHSAPDRVCKFWHGRAKSKIAGFVPDEGRITCRIECASEEGLVVRFPADEPMKSADVSVDGKMVRAVFKYADGLFWLMVPIAGMGGHILVIDNL